MQFKVPSEKLHTASKHTAAHGKQLEQPMTTWCSTLEKAQSFLYVAFLPAQMFCLIPDGINHSFKKDIMSGTEKTNKQDISAVKTTLYSSTQHSSSTHPLYCTAFSAIHKKCKFSGKHHSNH